MKRQDVTLGGLARVFALSHCVNIQTRPDMERVQPASGIDQQTCKTFIPQMDRRRRTQSPLHPPHPHIPIVVAKISIYFPDIYLLPQTGEGFRL